MIILQNDGAAVSGTNYWDSDPARAGYCYLSFNAGAARLLVPPPLEPAIGAMSTARLVIISRGAWPERERRDAYEVLFEDGSNNPYCIHLGAEQSDRLLPVEDHGADILVIVYARGGERLRLPGKYRIVDAIPCLKPWETRK
ncbi:MAG: hypothetical protein HZB29_09865 [Nitrospinae bacterium]|nr:hypothetical protein [Nitrospinota bacterium]